MKSQEEQNQSKNMEPAGGAVLVRTSRKPAEKGSQAECALLNGLTTNGWSPREIWNERILNEQDLNAFMFPLFMVTVTQMLSQPTN